MSLAAAGAGGDEPDACRLGLAAAMARETKGAKNRVVDVSVSRPGPSFVCCARKAEVEA